MVAQSGDARRTLADILTARGGEKEWQEALQLLEGSGSEGDAASLDRGAEARLLVRRGGKDNLEKARQLLEELIADDENAAGGDRLLLAGLYEAEGELQAARQQCLSVMGQPNPDPAHLVFYIGFLLRHDLQDEANTWLQQLERVAPSDLRTVALRARWLHGQDRTSEIEPLVEGLAERLILAINGNRQQRAEWKNQRKAQVCQGIASIYSSVEQHQAAESWYRRVVAFVPEGYQPLVTWLARQDRMTEAIDICLEAAKSDDSPRPATILVSVLISGKPTEESFSLAEPLLAKAVEDHKGDAGLLSSLASLRVVQQRTGDAIQLYRRVLKLRPKDAVALNNLATLLSEEEDTGEEALQLIEQAIRIVGPQAALLDTKGTILIYDGKADQAVPLLEEAATAAKPDPRYYLHLAAAYHQLGETEKAREAFKKAQDGDLEGQILTKKDQEFLRTLEQEFGQ